MTPIGEQNASGQNEWHDDHAARKHREDDTDDVNTFSNILWKIEKLSRLIAEKSSNLMGSYQFTNEELASRLYSKATA